MSSKTNRPIVELGRIWMSDLYDGVIDTLRKGNDELDKAEWIPSNGIPNEQIMKEIEVLRMGDRVSEIRIVKWGKYTLPGFSKAFLIRYWIRSQIDKWRHRG